MGSPDAPRYRVGDRASCTRCGAPGSPTSLGGKLVPVKGFRRPGRSKALQHSDPAFCGRRMGALAARTPTSRNKITPRPEDVR
jgi:hypothetical protein